MYLLSEDVLPFIQKHLISVYTELFMEIFSILENSPSFSTFYSASTIEDKGGEFYSGLEMFPFLSPTPTKLYFRLWCWKTDFISICLVFCGLSTFNREWVEASLGLSQVGWHESFFYRFFYKYKKEQSPGK